MITTLAVLLVKIYGWWILRHPCWFPSASEHKHIWVWAAMMVKAKVGICPREAVFDSLMSQFRYYDFAIRYWLHSINTPNELQFSRPHCHIRNTTDKDYFQIWKGNIWAYLWCKLEGQNFFLENIKCWNNGYLLNIVACVQWRTAWTFDYPAPPHPQAGHLFSYVITQMV